MLKNTFLHIPGIGEKTEQQMWYSGILEWDTFTKNGDGCLSAGKGKIAQKYIHESGRALATENPGYFDRLLPSNQTWRLFPEFRNTVVYLDIESTGLEPTYADITTIALYDGKSIRYYINGQNLDDFKTDIQDYQLIVTYNGKTFDVPFINHYFGIELNHAHIDLRYVLASLGYKGGLKRCEAAFGIDRGDVSGIDGFFAVLLWQEYVNNTNQKALDTLLAYNIEDVVNLEQLMVAAYNLKIKDTPFFASHLLDTPILPSVPFNADLKTVELIKREYML